MDTREAVLRFLPDRINQRNDLIVTPPRIAEDMINILPDDVWNSSTKFLDPMCKDGIFLYKIYVKLMASESLIAEFPDEMERKNHILHHQLYGVSPDRLCQLMTIRTVYGTLNTESSIKLAKSTNISDIRSVIEKEFNGMQFDVVAGNPPYNNDAYLDFVTMGHLLARKYDLWITPAKWQAKGGQKNEDFRKNIVPYMSKIVYYPDCTDVFAIGDPGGISYFMLDKNRNKEKIIKNISLKHKSAGKECIYNDEEKRQFNDILSNVGNKLIHRLGVYKTFGVENTAKDKRYEAWSANKVSLVSNIPATYLWSSDGVFNCLGLIEIIDTKQGNKRSLGVPEDSRLIYTADTKEECYYFKSWAYTRFVRFLLSLSLCGLTGIATSDTWWRFVPDPGAFDHIFTDQELYKKYNLTDEEINIIESVIKERK
jgi:site-specific DNA-methyltransferase (adenine-specific)